MPARRCRRRGLFGDPGLGNHVSVRKNILPLLNLDFDKHLHSTLYHMTHTLSYDSVSFVGIIKPNEVDMSDKLKKLASKKPRLSGGKLMIGPSERARSQYPGSSVSAGGFGGFGW